MNRLRSESETTSSEPPCVLYLGGTVLEPAAAPVLREAFKEAFSLRLRVRTHPRMDQKTQSELFGWLAPERLSDAKEIDLVNDICQSQAVITVRSTAVIQAYFLGVPVIWLTPLASRVALKHNSFRKQGLVVLEAFTASELRSVVERIAGDKQERDRIVAAQWANLRRLGFTGDYFAAVTSSIRKETGLARKLKTSC